MSRWRLGGVPEPVSDSTKDVARRGRGSMARPVQHDPGSTSFFSRACARTRGEDRASCLAPGSPAPPWGSNVRQTPRVISSALCAEQQGRWAETATLVPVDQLQGGILAQPLTAADLGQATHPSWGCCPHLHVEVVTPSSRVVSRLRQEDTGTLFRWALQTEQALWGGPLPPLNCKRGHACVCV